MQFGIFTIGDVTPDPTTGRIPTEHERLEAIVEYATLAEQVGLERRNDGDVVRLVRADLVPAVESFIADLNALVQLQEQMLARTLAQAERERTTSYALGLAALAVVVVLGLLLSIVIVRQITVPLAHAADTPWLAPRVPHSTLRYELTASVAPKMDR